MYMALRCTTACWKEALAARPARLNAFSGAVATLATAYYSILIHIRNRVFQQGFLSDKGSVSHCCSGQCFSQLCALEHFHTPFDGATGISDGHISLVKPLTDAN